MGIKELYKEKREEYKERSEFNKKVRDKTRKILREEYIKEAEIQAKERGKMLAKEKFRPKKSFSKKVKKTIFTGVAKGTLQGKKRKQSGFGIRDLI
jgi:hypothetical protein